MKITYTTFAGRTAELMDGLESIVGSACEPVHADGELERLREQVNNVTGMLGRLMVEMPGLDAKAIERILGRGYTVTED